MANSVYYLEKKPGYPLTRTLGPLFLVISILFCPGVFSAEYRAEFQLGINTGDTEVGGETDLFFIVEGTDFDSDTGKTIGAQFWIDKAYTDNFSLGFQYMRLIDADYGGSRDEFCIFCVPDTTQEHYSPEIDAFMINFLYRDNNGVLINEQLHPYIGVGLGVAQVDVDGIITTDSGAGTTTITGNEDDSGFAAQFLLGMDYDITENFYLGLNMSFFSTYVDLFNEEHQFDKFMGMVNAGYKF